MEPIPDHIGRYRVVAAIAEGGMAQILLGRLEGPLGVSQPVVIKRVLPHLARQERFRRMFLDEARLVAGIRHSNVVTVHELVGNAEQLYLVMEYLEGESLHSLMRWLGERGRRLSPAVACYVGEQAATGLHAAHEYVDEAGRPQRVVHRDVSPQNIFITYDGAVKLIDFGVAKAEDRFDKTTTGTVKGKFSYMAPEQLDGRDIDRRADIFATGVVVCEMSTGKRLFTGRSHAEVIRQICFGEIEPPRSVVEGYPAELETVVMRALAKEPDRRHESAAELARDLGAVGRLLEPSLMPREHLVALMDEAFGARRAEKAELLRGGSSAPIDWSAENTPSGLSEAVTTPAIRPADTAGPRAPDAPARTRPRRLLIGLAAVAALGAGGLLLAPWGERPPPSSRGSGATTVASVPSDEDAMLPPADSQREAEEPQASDSQPEQRAARDPSPMVAFTIDTDPDGARVWVGGEERARTPAVLSLPRSEEPVEVTVRRPGYREASIQIVPNADGRMEVPLRRRRRPTRPARPAPADTDMASGFFRVD